MSRTLYVQSHQWKKQTNKHKKQSQQQQWRRNSWNRSQIDTCRNSGAERAASLWWKKRLSVCWSMLNCACTGRGLASVWLSHAYHGLRSIWCHFFAVVYPSSSSLFDFSLSGSLWVSLSLSSLWVKFSLFFFPNWCNPEAFTPLYLSASVSLYSPWYVSSWCIGNRI